MRLRLTGGQACFIHGWLRAKRTLSWHDIATCEHMTLKHLLAARVPVAQLHQLQPDVEAWIRAGRVTLADCPAMGPWAPHPIRDFHADLVAIVEAKWSAETMHSMGLTYHDLVGVGLTFHNMFFFDQITLLGWAQLGLTRADVTFVPEYTLARLFCLNKMEVMRSLK